MRVFLVGANSYIGTHLASMLVAAGHAVSGLARSPELAVQMEQRQVRPVVGNILDVARATRSLRDYDVCIWLSFLSLDEERSALEALGSTLLGSDKTFIFTSGTGVLGIPSPLGEWSEESFAENDGFTPLAALAKRCATESLVRAWSCSGVRAMVIRPPMVWGHGGSRQVPWLFATVAKTGCACYIGHGLNIYSHVHVDDLCRLYCLAMTKGCPGATYHAVAGEENFRAMAEAVARASRCSARSVSLENMEELIGRTAARVGFGVNSRSRCPRSRSELGWAARRFDLVGDIAAGSYSRGLQRDSTGIIP